MGVCSMYYTTYAVTSTAAHKKLKTNWISLFELVKLLVITHVEDYKMRLKFLEIKLPGKS